MSLELMRRLVPPVPKPRLHLIRFPCEPAPSAKLRAMAASQEVEAHAQAAPPADSEANCTHRRPLLLSCAKLLKHVFELDWEHCPNCGGELKIIAVIQEQSVIEKILMHLARKFHQQ